MKKLICKYCDTSKSECKAAKKKDTLNAVMSQPENLKNPLPHKNDFKPSEPSGGVMI